MERLQDYHADLKATYQASTEKSALQALDDVSDKWNDKYPKISRSWKVHWENLNTLCQYPEDIRKSIHTTNAIESFNSVIRKPTTEHKVFPQTTRPS